MNSLDTNILVYAVNAGCEEHEKARGVYEQMIRSPGDWILSDQVLFEFYRALRHPKILEKPLDHGGAMRQIEFLREKSGVLHCAYETSFWNAFKQMDDQQNPKATHIFDRVLGVTLLRHGVRKFYTRNIKDFTGFDFKEVVNPIDV